VEEKINEFFLKWNGVGCDFDGSFGFQCMDIFESYNKDIIGGDPIYGNAIDVINKYPKDLYDYIPNAPDNFPSLGDIVLWTKDIGQFGHIAICVFADVNHFISFDQNFPIGSLCHFQAHNYQNIAGWLHPKASISMPSPETIITNQSKFDFGDPYGVLEMQAVRSQLRAKDSLIETLQTEMNKCKSDLLTCQNQPPVVTTKIVYQIKSFTDFLKRIFSVKAT
jgi:hypothetical protein